MPTTNAAAGNASGTGQAFGPSLSTQATAGNASGTGQAYGLSRLGPITAINIAAIAAIGVPTLTGVTLATPATISAIAMVGTPSTLGTVVSVSTIKSTAELVGEMFSDSFNRANSSSSLGSTDSAFGGTVATWTPLGGSVWGVNGNEAYLVTPGTGQDLVVIETLLSDCTIEETFLAAAACGVCWRVSDTDNNWVFDGNNNPPIVYKKVGGTYTAVATFSDTGHITTGDILKIVLAGNTHTIYRNGVQVATYSDAFNATATEHGLRSPADSTARFDNFKVLRNGIPLAIQSWPISGVKVTAVVPLPTIHANATGHTSTTPRWILHDPNTGQLYEFDLNPTTQDYLPFSKNILYKNSLPQESIIYEVQKDATFLSWSGTVLMEGQLGALQTWFDNGSVVHLTDDLGREFDIYITEFTPKRVRNATTPWLHTYDMKALVV